MLCFWDLPFVKAVFWNIYEIGPRGRFYQLSTYSFYARGAQMREKDSQVVSIFTLSGSTSIKAERKCVGEIDTWC
jgi:hypothetical protein